MERLIAIYTVGSSVGAVVALVVANLIPLIGVLFLGWSVWTILIVYWLENGVVGAYNVLKIMRAEGTESLDGGTTAQWTVNGRPASSMSKAGLVPFFVMHYGIFWIGHGVFVLMLPLFAGMNDGGADVGTPPDLWTIVLALVAMIISHGISYRMNFIGGGEYRRVSPQAQMFAPYGRLVVLHLTIIFGGIFVAMTGAPVVEVAILVLFKTAFDLALHLREHRGDAARVRASAG